MDTQTLAAVTHEIISNHGFSEVRRNLTNNQNALFALKTFQPGEVICDFYAGGIYTTPTYLTVQTGINRHITLQPEFLQYINHSCEPNVFFDTTTMQLICLRPLNGDDELTFFYPSTEWDMAQPFNCYCGSEHCLGEIRGAAYLSANCISQYRLTDFIQRQLHERATEKRA
ncbi:MAG: SET domain-containing protein-lysine N-methyltransferase [Sphingobacteriales bacterium]